jgi:hypothetical protein
MERMRAAIFDGSFEDERAAFLSRYAPADQVVAAEQRAKFRARAAGEPGRNRR